MFCTNCGKELKEGQIFCTYCGTMIQHKQNKKKKAIIISAVIIAVLLIIIGIVVSIFVLGQEPEEEKTIERKNESEFVIIESSENEETSEEQDIAPETKMHELTEEDKQFFEQLLPAMSWNVNNEQDFFYADYMLVYMIANEDSLNERFPEMVHDRAVPPIEILYQEVDEDGKMERHQCKIADLNIFLTNVYGRPFDIESEYSPFTDVTNDGTYLTEWGFSWHVSLEGNGDSFSDFSIQQVDDKVVASIKCTNRDIYEGDILYIGKFTTEWEWNEESPFGFTLVNSSVEDVFNSEKTDNTNSYSDMAEDEEVATEEADENHNIVGNVTNSFYGIWCTAGKKESDCFGTIDDLRANGYNPEIIVTTDWSNLNSEKYYVVTVGRYDSKEQAKLILEDVKELYPDAYVKYSGDYIGN